jgi:hypothetical protein
MQSQNFAMPSQKQTNKQDNSSKLYVYQMIISRLTKCGFSSLSLALDKKLQASSDLVTLSF